MKLHERIMFLITISIWVFLLLTFFGKFAKADTYQVYLTGNYIPIGGSSWHSTGDREWLYMGRELGIGLGSAVKYEDIKLSTRHNALLADEVGFVGMSGKTTLSLGYGFLQVSHKYYYRWYDGSEGDYGYSTGRGIYNTVTIDMAMPLFGG